MLDAKLERNLPEFRVQDLDLELEFQSKDPPHWYCETYLADDAAPTPTVQKGTKGIYHGSETPQNPTQDVPFKRQKLRGCPMMSQPADTESFNS